jgi:hypothetical protein
VGGLFRWWRLVCVLRGCGIPGSHSVVPPLQHTLGVLSHSCLCLRLSVAVVVVAGVLPPAGGRASTLFVRSLTPIHASPSCVALMSVRMILNQ